MEFGVAQTKAVLQNPIEGIHQVGQYSSIRSLGHLDLHGQLVYLVVFHRRSRDQVHGAEEEQEQYGGGDQTGDRTGDSARSRPNLVMPERRYEEAYARPEEGAPEGHQPPLFLR